jgi:hypothetical protein
VLDNADYFTTKATYAQRNLLFHNDGGGRLREVGRASGPGFALVKVSRGLAVGDIDNDGSLDRLVTNKGQTADLLRNVGGNRKNSVLLRLVARKSNRDAIGARSASPQAAEPRCEKSKRDRATFHRTICGCTSDSAGPRKLTGSRSAGPAARPRPCASRDESDCQDRRGRGRHEGDAVCPAAEQPLGQGWRRNAWPD